MESDVTPIPRDSRGPVSPEELFAAPSPPMDPKLLADQRLMEAVARGEAVAQKELVDRLWRRVHNTARYLSRDSVEAEDISQEIMIQILLAAPGYRARGCLEAWADVIAVRTIRARLRWLRWTRWLLGTDLDETVEPRAGDGAEPEHRLLAAARASRLGSLLARLNKKQHMAIVLKVVYGYSVEEVAELMEEHPETVRYLVRKARSRLRQLALKDPALAELRLEGRS